MTFLSRPVRLNAAELIRVALELGADRAGGPLSERESVLCRRYEKTMIRDDVDVHAVRAAIRSGGDPLGESWQRGMSIHRRLTLGAVYTPRHIVCAMVRWTARWNPVRVVDMGCGSGQFTLEAARRLPRAAIVAVDIDPVATIITRASLAAIGRKRARVIQGDYLDLPLKPVRGPTAFIGNPPYVRHHRLSKKHKVKAAAIARALGYELSSLSGLHTHFLIATAVKAMTGDLGCVITSAEWMQAAYGHTLRSLFAERLGLEVLHLLDPKAMAFPGVMTTAVIVGFHAGSRRHNVVAIAHATSATLGHANGSTVQIPRSCFKSSRWSFILHLNGLPADGQVGIHRVPLGSFCRVHRGIATGANGFFVMTAAQADARGLLPWVRPVLTRAREVLKAEGLVRRQSGTKVLLCPPADINLTSPDSRALRAYLKWGERRGLHRGYLCAHRHPWWYLGSLRPAPIVATYMARRPPSFAVNPRGLLVLNVFHGLYPETPMNGTTRGAIVRYLNAHSARFRTHGRVHQGGLWKFEPRELEAIKVLPIGKLTPSR